MAAYQRGSANTTTPLRAPRLRLITRERRRTPRVTGPFSTIWSGASGPACRVADLSAHGCYVNSLSAPSVGSLVTLSFVTDQGRRLCLQAEVRTIDRDIGFSVQFTEMPSEDLSALAAWIASRTAADPDGVRR